MKLLVPVQFRGQDYYLPHGKFHLSVYYFPLSDNSMPLSGTVRVFESVFEPDVVQVSKNYPSWYPILIIA